MERNRSKRVFDQLYENMCLRDELDETLVGLYKFPGYSKIASDANILESAQGRLYFVPYLHRNEVHVVHPTTRNICLLYRYEQEVTGIKANNRRFIIVITTTDVHIHERTGDEFKRVTHYHSMLHLNPSLVAVSSDPNVSQPLLVLPELYSVGNAIEVWSIVQKTVVTIIRSHHCVLGYVAINYNSTMLASATTAGNVVKVFHINGELLYKLRRGLDRTTVDSLAFSFDSNYLACASKGEPIYVYKLAKDARKRLQTAVDYTAAAARFVISLGEASATPAQSHFACIHVPKGVTDVRVHGFLPTAIDSCALLVSDGTSESARVFSVDEEKGGRCVQKMNIMSPPTMDRE